MELLTKRNSFGTIVCQAINVDYRVLRHDLRHF